MDALRSAQEAVRITEALDDPRGASEALDALGNIQAITTDLRGALESQSRRLRWAQRLEDTAELVDIHGEVCMAHTLVGDFAEAVEHGRESLAMATTADADLLRMRALRSADARLLRVGSLAGGDPHRRGANQWRTAPTHATVAAPPLGAAGLGHRPRAHRRARRGGRADATGEYGRRPCEEAYVELFKARLALARGATKEARQLLLSAVEARSGRFILPALLAELAELGARTGERALFDRFSAQALELGWRSGARKAQAQATRARGIVAVSDEQWDDALTDLAVRPQSLPRAGHAVGGGADALCALWTLSAARRDGRCRVGARRRLPARAGALRGAESGARYRAGARRAGGW